MALHVTRPLLGFLKLHLLVAVLFETFSNRWVNITNTNGGGLSHNVAPAPKIRSATATSQVASISRPCQSSASDQFQYCNRSLAREDRISSLLSDLTAAEKVSLLGNDAAAVPRLGLPFYQWWNEALHGVASWGCCPPGHVKSTSFPQVCALASSFNRSLWEAVGDAIGSEAAEHFWGAGDVPGLTFWSPNVNIFRDPRWGRGQETPGEDPFLTSEYAESLIPAMQYGLEDDGRTKDGGGSGADPRVAAACKHFAAYSIETGRISFDAKLDPRDWNDSYSPAFERCVKSGALGFMCSYNSVDGVPSCANTKLLRDTLRDEWGFDGYVTGDCGAVAFIRGGHHFVDSLEQASTKALQAGVDVDCGNTIQTYGMSAIEQGLLTEEDIDGALGNLLRTQFRLGYFDSSPSATAERALTEEDRERHNEMALDAARQAVVLLKNEVKSSNGHALPLSTTTHKTVALMGPHAGATVAMQGNYHGIAPFLISPKQGLEALGVTVRYHHGSNVTSSPDSKIDPKEAEDICQSASEADATVLVMGLDQSVESEGRDRASLTLPGSTQDELIALASKCAKKDGNDRSVVLVVMTGGPIDLSIYKEGKEVDAIIHLGYPGQAGGAALAEALFGLFNPSGRLTTTIYPEEFSDEVEIGDMRMRPSTDGSYPGRTHRFFTGDVVYPFGYGLSYSTFKYRASGSVSVPVTELFIEVSNLGPMDGSHSLLLFHAGPSAGYNGDPIRSLIGFEKVFLVAGDTSTVTMAIDPNVTSSRGKHTFFVGQYEECVFEVTRYSS